MGIVRDAPTNDISIRHSGEEDIKQGLIHSNSYISDRSQTSREDKSSNKRKSCQKPCSSQDSHLICMLVAIVLLVLAFMYLKTTRQIIAQVT